MKLRSFLILVFLPLLFVLASCSLIKGQLSHKQTSSSSGLKHAMSTSQLIDKMDKANQKLTSMKMKADFATYEESDSPVSSQDMTASLIYKKGTGDLVKGKASFDSLKEGKKSFEEIVMPGGSNNPVYSRQSETGTWEKMVAEDEEGDYYIRPDYFKVWKVLSEMADDLKVKEDSQYYTLTLTSQNTDLLGLFKEQFNLELSNLDQLELDKSLTVKVNKKTFYMEKFDLGFKYDGDRGKIKLLIHLKYFSLNKVDKNAIKVPSDI
ncbi:DUF6612 family protein [Streptococcus oricebi]|uniref:Lipoprotein n=1 Tax=Streptococcus oricebi TaxID=1547447 RepID=A0ABS5B298_9STRE|nr:DUF6612 family protein [Streptococcus oricebi]MBP2622791.1 hypothetical protein [Streptococcus oricebi]